MTVEPQMVRITARADGRTTESTLKVQILRNGKVVKECSNDVRKILLSQLRWW